MAASGAPLGLLYISDCEISAEHASDLQKLFKCYYWDGIESLVDQSESIDDDDDDHCSCEDCNCGVC